MARGSAAEVVAPGETQELRLALVCYGGVSLAIYMYGVAREVHSLVVASCAYERDPQTNPFASEQTEHVYYDMLSRLAEGELGPRGHGVRKRVVVDVVSGTSAGGINGICLAKALAGNRSLEPLKKVWFEKGDIGKLLAAPRWMPERTPALLKAAWLGARMALRPTRIAPPLAGDKMCLWLYEAFDAMDAAPAPLEGVDTLMPPDHALELFVPVTDFRGYDREIPLEDPKVVADRTHRYVMSFRRDGDRDQFGRRYNHALAFAARATSSFPGAFPPISVPAYEGAVGAGANLRVLLDELFASYALSPGAHPDQRVHPDETHFVDGGVLDNAPFQTSIEAVKLRAASAQVDRRLLYIQPDPRETATPYGDAAPTWLGTIWGGVAGIPRKEPVIDDLVRVADQNVKVGRIRDIIEASFETIRGQVHDVMAGALAGTHGELPAPASHEDLLAWEDEAERTAAERAGFGYATYLRLRIRLVLDAYARAIADALSFPGDHYQAWFVTSVLRAWAQEAGLFHQDAVATTDQRSFLDALDLEYHGRRIRFLIAAMSWWYRPDPDVELPARAALDEAKARLYRHLADLQDIARTLGGTTPIGDTVRDIFDPRLIRRAVTEQQESASSYAQRMQEQLTTMRKAAATHLGGRLPDLRLRLYTDLREVSLDWSERVKDDLLVRYLGFPFWDVLTYPIQGLSGAGERDHVEVSRISPVETRLLEPHPQIDRLSGVSFAHFGAFFSRAGRENDYLWGRLDAAERLVNLLLDDAADPGMEPAEGDERRAFEAACRAVFDAILAAETPVLTGLDERLVPHLRKQVAALVR